MHLFYEVRNGKATNTSILRPSFAVWVMAQGARPNSRLPAMCHNIRHSRVVTWEPIRGAERILDLRLCELQIAAWQLFESRFRTWLASCCGGSRVSAVRP